MDEHTRNLAALRRVRELAGSRDEYDDPRSLRRYELSEDGGEDSDEESQIAFGILRAFTRNQFLNRYAYHFLFDLFNTNRRPGSLACAEAFLLGWYARPLVDVEKSENKVVANAND